MLHWKLSKNNTTETLSIATGYQGRSSNCVGVSSVYPVGVGYMGKAARSSGARSGPGLSEFVLRTTQAHVSWQLPDGSEYQCSLPLMHLFPNCIRLAGLEPVMWPDQISGVGESLWFHCRYRCFPQLVLTIRAMFVYPPPCPVSVSAGPVVIQTPASDSNGENGTAAFVGFYSVWVCYCFALEQTTRQVNKKTYNGQQSPGVWIRS